MVLSLGSGTPPHVASPQGDALSILWANLTSAVSAKGLYSLYIWVRNIAGLRTALEHARIYDVLCRSRLNPDKTKALL